jgi:hypothetical protein
MALAQREGAEGGADAEIAAPFLGREAVIELVLWSVDAGNKTLPGRERGR